MKAKLFIATPMYGGMCHGIYAISLANLLTLCLKENITAQLQVIYNESLIQRARNNCADQFLQSDCTHLLFIDSDIGFHAQDVLTMLSFFLKNTANPYSVLAGVYPKKMIDWNRVLQTAKKDTCQNSLELPLAGNQFTFNPKQGTSFTFNPESLVEVAEAGTGFMMIPRKTLETHIKTYPEKSYTHETRKIHAFFDAGIDPETNLYLAEDYMFCKEVRNMGGKIGILPRINLTHAGSYNYTGSLAESAISVKK